MHLPVFRDGVEATTFKAMAKDFQSEIKAKANDLEPDAKGPRTRTQSVGLKGPRSENLEDSISISTFLTIFDVVVTLTLTF